MNKHIKKYLYLWAALAMATLAAPANAQAQSKTLVIGDSLVVGIAQPLRKQLGGKVKIDARVGRPLTEGMRHFQTSKHYAPVVAFSLFTNDDPRHVQALSQAVSVSLRDKPRGCVIWATIYRPAVGGVSYNRANAMLRRRDQRNKRLVVVDWSREIYRHPQLIGSDHVHPTPQGYRRRAQMYVQAIKKCQDVIALEASR